MEELRVATDELPLRTLLRGAETRPFRFGPLEGDIEISALHVADGLFRTRAHVTNRSPLEPADREEALQPSLLSCHALLGAREGAFVPLTDPPPAWAAHAEQCANQGTWPVLVGRSRTAGADPLVADHPARLSRPWRPRVHGDLFDGTEIDELLSLRIRTLSDAEKEEMRGADDRARRLLDRTEALSDDELLALHGTWRREPAAPAAGSIPGSASGCGRRGGRTSSTWSSEAGAPRSWQSRWTWKDAPMWR